MTNLIKRKIKERIFVGFARIAAFSSLIILILIIGSILQKGYSAFFSTKIELEVNISIDQADENLKEALYKAFLAESRADKKLARNLLSSFSHLDLEKYARNNQEKIGSFQKIWLLGSDLTDSWFKGEFDEMLENDSSNQGQIPIKDKQLDFLNKLAKEGSIDKFFAKNLFINSDSRYPEMAGLFGATIGSFMTIIIAILLAFPIGVGSAIYLEEYARKSRLNILLEININNLAAVPSIIFGLLGLSFLLNFLDLPRSASLVGGIVLAMMIMPVIVIASRASLRSVPPSIREASLALGASKSQTVFHHVIPYSLPGIMTGAIISVARALGETAPLLLIGMVAFITQAPKGLFDPATVLPVQIYIWADSPERAFMAKTSAAIIVLLVFLILLNLTAQIIRKKTTKKW